MNMDDRYGDEGLRDEWDMIMIMWMGMKSNMRNEFCFKNEMSDNF